MGSSDQKCGCGNSNKNIIDDSSFDNHFIIDSIQTPAGDVPRISSQLNARDHIGAFQVRLGFRRDRYRVAPGLYAVGTPNENSDVLVTANYKLTFDTVRKNLNGSNVWLLILDTKGINVWCSAGKGTFGTKELVHRIKETSLGTIVKHRRLVLPQLGATGVAAHLVKEYSGFTVIYGPVRIPDIQEFIRSGYKATKEMRRVNFDLYDRAKLIPNDFVCGVKYLSGVLLLLFILLGIHSDGFSLQKAMERFTPVLLVVLAGYISGIVLTPLFLPYLPFRSFSFKGFLMGIIVSFVLFFRDSSNAAVLIILAKIFFISGISSFLAMNFTGSSTYTSLAGVKKEMKIAVPFQIVSVVLALVLVISNTLLGWR